MKLALSSFLGLAALLALNPSSVQAGQIGFISVCYACQNTGDPIVDAALANNPAVASDGILFAFINSSAFAITGGVFSVGGTSPADSFLLPTIAAGAEFILIPGVSNDGGSHPVGGLFGATGVMDTSDGSGSVTDSSIFKFVGLSNGLSVSSLTAGTSTGIAGTFTPGDPGLFKPFRDNPLNGTTSFIGDGPSGDGGCSNCYYGAVATLNTPSTTATPEPTSAAMVLVGLGTVAWIARRRATP